VRSFAAWAPGTAEAGVVMVAELAGHRRLDTTRRYSLPSQADRQAAMERLERDY
jgi:integrase/recombinase XerC